MKKRKFSELLNSINIDQVSLLDIAFETGLIKRQRLINPTDLLYAICSEATNGTASYNDIAAQIEAESGVSVSRQAVWKKATAPCEEFFKKILELTLLNKVDKLEMDSLRKLKKAKRILVQDSTIIRLPVKLFEYFSGVANQNTKLCNARIQCVYDLLAEEFVSFSIDPYSKNDLSAASETVLHEDDLVLRDRGYLILDEIQRHINNKAHCIYRYKTKTIILDPKTEQPLDLLTMLEKNGNLDMEVLMNNENKTAVRIVAEPVSEKIANYRRRKAKQKKKRL